MNYNILTLIDKIKKKMKYIYINSNLLCNLKKKKLVGHGSGTWGPLLLPQELKS